MPLSPLQGGTTIKPNSTDPRPTAQTYFRDDCTTLVVHDFLNELISLFVNANAFLGLPNAQNDPDALRKMLQNILTGKRDFQVSDLAIFNKVGDGASTSFYGIDNLRGGFIALNETLNYIGISKQSGNVTANTIALKDAWTEFDRLIKADTLQELTSGNGVRLFSDLYLTAGKLQFGNPAAQASRDFIGFDDATDTFTFFENNNARGATILAGAGNFNTTKTAEISELVTGQGVKVEDVVIKGTVATITEVNSPSSFRVKIDTNLNGQSDGFEVNHGEQGTRFRVTDDGLTQIRKPLGAEMLALIDDNAPNATIANPFMTFKNSATTDGASTRLGYFGYGSDSNADLYQQNDYGNNRFNVPSGFSHLFNEVVRSNEIRTGNIEEFTPGQGVFIESMLFYQNGIDFGQGARLNNYTETEFTPITNFASSSLLTVKEGVCIRTGSTASVWIRIAGPAAARFATGSIIMEVTGIPNASAVTRRSALTVIEQLGSYAPGTETTQGIFQTSTNAIRFVEPTGTARSLGKTVADWAAGDFDFFITGTLFFK